MIKNFHTFQSGGEQIKWGRNISKRTIKPQLGKISLTQSLFPSKKTSFQTNFIESNSKDNSKKCLNDFYQTLGPTLSGEWVRPESKRNSRKQHQRPQTSKGSRVYHKQKQVNRNYLTSKSMYDGLSEEKENEKYEHTNCDSIKIIVNKNKNKKGKHKSIYSQKLKTDLPDDFLSLFAD